MATCETCNDTHSMSLRGSLVPCTRCPTPCQECRINGRGAYCAKTPCACACHSIVDRPAPTPAVTPGLDLDTAEKRAAGFRGRFRVMAYDSGDELLEFVALDAYNCDESEIDGGDLDEIAQFACDDTVQRAIVDTLNEAPALIAEVRALRAKLAAAREAAQRDRDVAQAMAKAAHEAEEEMAAARAVPADVEAAIEELRRAEEVDARAMTGQSFAARVLAEANLRAAIARAIRDARTAAIGAFIDQHAQRIVKEAGETWNGDDEQADAWASQIHRVLNCLRTDSDGVIHDGRATAAPATVGGLPATAPVARPISEWHEDHGDALWWRFPIEEPPYCGSPISDDWPGDYHTHWTPIVCPDDPTQRGPLLAATAPVCPGPDCPMCNGEACDKCNPGPGRPRCDHDGQERHELPTAAPRPQCPTHGDTVNCYCTTGALHCHDCGHTPPFCTACDGYHDDGPCPLPKGG